MSNLFDKRPYTYGEYLEWKRKKKLDRLAKAIAITAVITMLVVVAFWTALLVQLWH